MRKIKYLLFILLIVPFNIFASNKINNINMNIHLNEDGSANITETWDVYGVDGTEWYKVINGFYSEDIHNFKVKMDGNDLTYKTWNIDETLSEKKGYYGINYTSDGIELCWGKYNLHSNHIFTLEYTLDNVIENIDDAQILYFTFISTLSNVKFNNFYIQIDSYFDFEDTLDVWGFGYKGYAYVNDGKIYMSNEENTPMDDSYAVALVKFDLNTFSSSKTYSYANTFDEVLSLAKEGSYEYDYDNDSSSSFNLFNIIFNLIRFAFFLVPFIIIIKTVSNKKYGYIDNKTIPKGKDLNMFHEIPCNKDINYANTLLYLNNRDYKESNILGAIILDFIKKDIVEINKNNSEELFIKSASNFDFELEQEIYDLFVLLSDNNILHTKKLKKWCTNNYAKFFKYFSNNINLNVKSLENKGEIRTRNSKSDCKSKSVLSDNIYRDSVKLYGLKLFLKNMSDIKNKDLIDVKLWDQYLMFAFLFNIADKVSKTLKTIYPSEINTFDYDYNTIIIIQNISSSSVNAASAARNAAQSYSSGGGGFSSGGGGGFSSGGGGGGSR